MSITHTVVVKYIANFQSNVGMFYARGPQPVVRAPGLGYAQYPETGGKGEPVCFFSGGKVLERIHYLKRVKLRSKREGPEAAALQQALCVRGMVNGGNPLGPQWMR